MSASNAPWSFICVRRSPPERGFLSGVGRRTRGSRRPPMPKASTDATARQSPVQAAVNPPGPAGRLTSGFTSSKSCAGYLTPAGAPAGPGHPADRRLRRVSASPARPGGPDGAPRGCRPAAMADPLLERVSGRRPYIRTGRCVAQPPAAARRRPCACVCDPQPVASLRVCLALSIVQLPLTSLEPAPKGEQTAQELPQGGACLARTAAVRPYCAFWPKARRVIDRWREPTESHQSITPRTFRLRGVLPDNPLKTCI